MRPLLFISGLTMVAVCSAAQRPVPNQVAVQDSVPSGPAENDEVFARTLLTAPGWESKAWGAFRAGRLRTPALQALLVSELGAMRPFVHAAEGSPEFAYVRSILDALITSGASAPSEAVLPFISVLPAESLILLSRSGAGERTLLGLLATDFDTPEWLVVGKLLLKLRSGQFLAEMLKGAESSHDFDISSVAARFGRGGSFAIGPGCCPPEVIRQFPPRFPPIGIYELVTTSLDAERSPGTGDVLVLPAPYPVYYRRIVVPAGGSVRSPGLRRPVTSRRLNCMGFLAESAKLDLAEVRRSFAAVTYVQWTNAEAAKSLVDQALNEQEQRIRQLVKLAKESGFRSVPPLQLRIEVRTVDHRAQTHDPIPTFNSRQINID